MRNIRFGFTLDIRRGYSIIMYADNVIINLYIMYINIYGTGYLRNLFGVSFTTIVLRRSAHAEITSIAAARNVTNPYKFMPLYLHTYLYSEHNSVLIEYSNVHDPYTLTG